MNLQLSSCNRTRDTSRGGFLANVGKNSITLQNKGNVE